MKKAQTVEFIGIALLVLALVIFMLFSRIGATKSAIDKAEMLASNYEQLSLSKGSLILVKTTYNGRSILSLIGDYACYGNEIADYGDWYTINITEAFINTLDPAYGADYYAIEIFAIEALSEESFCYHKGFYPGECEFSEDLKMNTYSLAFPLPCQRGNFSTAIFYNWIPE